MQIDPTSGETRVLPGWSDLYQTLGVVQAADGFIYVTTQHGFNGRAAVGRVDPSGGGVTVIASHLHSEPSYLANPKCIAVEADGQLVVGDRGRVVRVDPTTGAQSIVAENPSAAPDAVKPLDNVNGIAVEADGHIVVSSSGPQTTTRPHTIVRIHPRSGSLSVLACYPCDPEPRCEWQLRYVSGLAIDPDGNILVTSINCAGGGRGVLLRYGPGGGDPEVVSHGGLLGNSKGIVVAPDGTIYVTNLEGIIVAVDPGSGEQSLVCRTPAGWEPFGIALVTVPTNHPPTACASVESNPLALSGDSAVLTLDGSCSDDGDGGTQGLSFTWKKLSGSPGDTLHDADAETARVTVTREGVYIYELVVDDGQPRDSSDATTVEITVTRVDPPPRFRRGDANDDGEVDVSDARFVIGFLFLGGPPPGCLEAADYNDDGEVDIADPIGTLMWLFLGGSESADPGPLDCGPDPAGSPPLSCDTYTSC